ncbi:hypothetical protein VaNZ11_009910 [Volvox africanus]|uniref:Ribonuclease H1 N-terminal domain-containing protein n=1 Tax=Volvox africanus TaxID=51714 RepID=A0ABQ5S9S4_9CHLO|nr:hypothetical protein VaNZ11_009910 [Volvox africanus]
MSAATYGCNTHCYRSGQPRSGVPFQIPQGAQYGPYLRHLQPAWPLGPSAFRKFEAPSRGSVVTHARRKWYAVFEPSPVRGVYRVWEQVQQLVSGQSNAVHKGFASEAAALEWISKLTLRAREEDATLEHLRRVMFGSNYRVGQPAALTSSSCLVASHASTNSGSGGSVARDVVSSTDTPGPFPRPWQTPPIVLPVPTAPSREYYRKWYAVRFVDGGTPGVYNTWQEAEAAISGRYAEHRSFDSQAEALAYAFGSSYVEQLLPAQQQQQEEQLQPVEEEEDTRSAALSGLHQLAANEIGFDSAAASHPSSSLSEHVDLPPEYDPYNQHSYFPYGADGDDTVAHGSDYERGEISSWMSPSVPYGLPTGLRMPVLAAWGAATVRQPLPAQPNGGDGRSTTSSSSLIPLPAPPAMTMPLSYDAPYAGPAMPAMVLTAAAVATPARGANRGLSRGRHHHHHHRHRSSDCINSEGPTPQQSPCAASTSSSSAPLSSVANFDSFPTAAAAVAPSSLPSLLSAGEAVECGVHDPDLNSPDPDSVRARQPRRQPGNRLGNAETAVVASRQEEYGSDRTTPVKRRRGRPRKVSVAEISPLLADGSGAGSVAHMPQTKRPRGRPRKQHGSNASTAVVSEPEPAVAKRGRGRPRKGVAVRNESTVAEMINVKRPRGRPRSCGEAAAATATQPKGRGGVGLPGEMAAKAEHNGIKAASLPPPSEAVVKEPVKSWRGRPRNPYPHTGLAPGGWTPRAPGGLCLEPDRPYILAFHWGQARHTGAPEPHPTAPTTSIAVSPALPPTSPGANPGRRTNPSATTQPGSLELSYSVLLLDGEDYSLVASKTGSIWCQHPAEGTYELLNLCVQGVVRKCGLRRVQLLGTGLRPEVCPPASAASLSSLAAMEGGPQELTEESKYQQAPPGGKGSREGGLRSASLAETELPSGGKAVAAVAAGEAAVAADVEWNVLHDEPTRSGAAKTLRVRHGQELRVLTELSPAPPPIRGETQSVTGWSRRLEGANESLELMSYGAERDALLTLAARLPELQLTVERLVGEWAPRYDKCTLLSTTLAVQSELYGLRRELIQNGLGVTAGSAADAAPGASATVAAEGGEMRQEQQGNAAGDLPAGAAVDGSELLLALHEVLGGMASDESSTPAHLLVRAFILRKLHLDLITWLESPFERQRFLIAAGTKSSSSRADPLDYSSNTNGAVQDYQKSGVRGGGGGGGRTMREEETTSSLG